MPNEAVKKTLSELCSAVGDMMALVENMLPRDMAPHMKDELVKPIHDALYEARAAIRAIDLTKPVEG